MYITPVILVGVCRMLKYFSFFFPQSPSHWSTVCCCFCTQDFELEVTGAHIIKVNIFSKQLLKEETHAHGKIRVSHITTTSPVLYRTLLARKQSQCT